MDLEQRRILRTSIPGPASQILHSRRQQVVSSGVGALLPVYIDGADGAIMRDVDGNQFIDLGSGIGVVTIGHTNQQVVDAVSKQANHFTHTLFTVTPYEPYVRAAELLTANMKGDFPKKAAFFVTGAEALENVVKIARLATGRHEVAVFDHAYHGRTNLTMAMNFKRHPYGTNYGPLATSVTHAPMSYPMRDPEGMTGEQAALRAINYLEKRVGADQLACMVIEPIQGEGGFIIPAPGFLSTLGRWAKENGIIMVADEVQSGMARTGKWFAYEYEEDFQPDLVTVAKGIAGGMPVSAVVGRAEIMDMSHPGGLGGTFGGSPTAVAAAVAVMEQFENGPWLNRALEIGEIMQERLDAMVEKYPFLAERRGRGAMQALEVVQPDTLNPDAPLTEEILRSCYERGVIPLSAGTYGNVIRMLPPLAITDALLLEAMDVLDSACSDIAASRGMLTVSNS